jgi:hypothetical protein
MSPDGTPQRGSSWGLQFHNSIKPTITFQKRFKPLVMETQTQHRIFDNRTDDGEKIPLNIDPSPVLRTREEIVHPSKKKGRPAGTKNRTVAEKLLKVKKEIGLI